MQLWCNLFISKEHMQCTHVHFDVDVHMYIYEIDVHVQYEHLDVTIASY